MIKYSITANGASVAVVTASSGNLHRLEVEFEGKPPVRVGYVYGIENYDLLTRAFAQIAGENYNGEGKKEKERS